MYTLRKIDRESIESNFWLGKEYVLVLREQPGSGKEFNKALAAHLGVPDTSASLTDEQVKQGENVYGFMFNSGGQMIPLIKGNSYYVMTESGETFSNLSNRYSG